MPDIAGEQHLQRAAQRGRVRDEAVAGNVVRCHRRGRGDVVVVAAVLVVGPDEQRVRPARAMHDPADHLGGEAFALADVLRVLLRETAVVRVDDAERREIAGVGIGEELLNAADVGHVADHPERVKRRRELQIPLERVAGLTQRTAEGGQMVPGPAAPVPHEAAELGLVAAGRPVVDPGDLVPAQHVHDRACPRPVQQVDRQVIHQAIGCPRQQEPAVRERRPEARAEPSVGQRKGPGQPVVEGQILVGPVGHRRRLVALGRGLLDRGDETVHLPAGPL